MYRVYVSVKVGYAYERCWIAQRAAGGSKLQSMSQEGGHLVGGGLRAHGICFTYPLDSRASFANFGQENKIYLHFVYITDHIHIYIYKLCRLYMC